MVGVVRVAERDRKGMRLYLHGRNSDGSWQSRWQSVNSREQAVSVARSWARRWDSYQATFWNDDWVVWIEAG